MSNRQKRQPQASRRVLLAESDVEAARRLLGLLAGCAHSERDRQERLQQAQAELDFRYRRAEVMGRFAAEAPFALLLALYTTEHREGSMTVTRLTEVALLKHSTTLRWLDELVPEGWVERGSDREDARKVLLCLTSKARDVLDKLFA